MAEPRRRLLFLLPFPPRLDADHGGSRVLAHLLSQLALRHEVGLIYLQAEAEPALDPLLQQRCQVVATLVRPTAPASGKGRWTWRARVWLSWLRGRPEWVHNWALPAATARIAAAVHRWQPQIVQVEYQVMAQYLPALGNYPAPSILTVHEPATSGALEALREAAGWGRLQAWLEARAWRRFEQDVLQKAGAIVVFTEADREQLRPGAGSTPLVVIPLGLTPARALSAPSPGDSRHILFVGNYAHAPNLDAALRLTDAIFPRVQERHRGARLWIVGSQPPPRLQARAGDDIVVTGYVADLTPYLRQAGVVVAPLRRGGGMRVKVLEALAAGKALVASERAVAGLALQDGEHYLRAEDDAQFAAAVCSLLAQPATRAGLASRAFQWAQQAPRWEDTVARYEQLYSSLLAGTPPSPVSLSRENVVSEVA